MTKITLDAGRVISRDGKPFIAIQRLGDTSPVAADEMARHITDWIALSVEGGDHPALLDTVLDRPERGDSGVRRARARRGVKTGPL